MSRLFRTNCNGEHQVRKGQKWVKPTASIANPEKLKRWQESSRSKKRVKEEDESRA